MSFAELGGVAPRDRDLITCSLSEMAGSGEKHRVLNGRAEALKQHGVGGIHLLGGENTVGILRSQITGCNITFYWRP